MIPYSQRDPAWRDRRLGASKLTMGTDGCFVTAIAMLYQVSPIFLLSVPNGINDSGNCFSNTLARACGGEALDPTTEAPKGWCIGVTDHFAPQSPTHFLCVNMDLGLQIDPLDLPAGVEPLSYKIIRFRPFTNIKLDTTPVADPFADVPGDSPLAPLLQSAKNFGLIQGYADGTFKPDQPITRAEAVALMMKASSLAK